MENRHECRKLIPFTTLLLALFALLMGSGVGNSDSPAAFLGKSLPLFSFFIAAVGLAFYCSLTVVFLGQHFPAPVFCALLWTSVVSITSAFCLLFIFEG